MNAFLLVALGGALGSALRYAVSLAVIGGAGFPLAVLTVNVVGSFLMGLSFVYVAERELGSLLLFFQVGLLGGFTTFSAFSLEVFALYEQGLLGQAALYILLSVGLSVGALFAGIFLMRSVS